MFNFTNMNSHNFINSLHISPKSTSLIKSLKDVSASHLSSRKPRNRHIFHLPSVTAHNTNAWESWLVKMSNFLRKLQTASRQSNNHFKIVLNQWHIERAVGTLHSSTVTFYNATMVRVSVNALTAFSKSVRKFQNRANLSVRSQSAMSYVRSGCDYHWRH